MRRQPEFVICDRFIEEYQRIGKKPPCHRSRLSAWRTHKTVPSAIYLQMAALDGCDVHYILTGRRKDNAVD